MANSIKPRGRATRKPLRTSQILRQVLKTINASSQPEVSIKTVSTALGERASGFAILIFAFPNMLPISSIPGFSTVTGTLIILFSLQFMKRTPSLWLPPYMANYHVSQEKMSFVIKKIIFLVRKTELFLNPRLNFFNYFIFERMIASLIIILAILLITPIPFGNFLPGLSMSVLALGIIEKDGLVIILGLILTSLTFLITSATLTMVVSMGKKLFY